MKISHTFFSALLSIIFIVVLQGCIKDTCTRSYSYTWFEPLYKTTTAVRENIKTQPATAIRAIGKLFVKDKYIFLNEINKGIHIIDNTNPAVPVNIGFIEVPGNIDIAVKGNILYADLYTDLVAIDISNPLNVVRKKIIDNVFPERFYEGFTTDSSKIIFDWIRHDTTIIQDCNNAGTGFYNNRGVAVLTDALTPGNRSFAGGSPTGIAGSMARFALMNNYLYTAGQYNLKAIDITSPQSPVVINTIPLGWGIETIYPFEDKLFIGSTTGMLMYSITDAANPVQAGTFSHARVCDPVIADDKYAYVTLRNGSTCAGFLNELNIVDVSNLSAPVLIKKYDLTNPHGLSKDGNLLFICDGADGLKIFDAADVNNIQLKKHLPGLETYDVIAYNGLALVVAKDGLYQFDYSNINNVQQLSKISIAQ